MGRRVFRSRRGSAVAVAVVAAAAIALPLSSGSSHREAPNLQTDPTADNTDTYAFTAPDAPGSITVAANWIPGQVPANGPLFFRFDDRARYYLNFDNNGDGNADVRYRFEFKTKVLRPNSNLYSLDGAQSFDDPSLNLRQSYDITRETYRNGKLKSTKKVARNVPSPPSNVGPKTLPNYSNFVNASIRNLPGGGKVFAGQRDDSFFLDLGATFDSINLRVGTGNAGGGKDDFSDLSTSSIVLQIPERLVTRNRKAVSSMDSSNAVVGVWASTERRRIEVTNARFSAGSPKKVGGRANPWVQVSRLGNPLVNELLVPIGMKDKYNRLTPAADPKFLLKYVQTPELARFINRLFPVVNAPETNRTDLVQAVLSGLPGLNRFKGKFAGRPTDTLKINLGVPPTTTPDRFGVLNGDMAGFPNGRRLEDDVADIDIQVVAGFLRNNLAARALGDGVDQNDKPFLPTFPYLADPSSGFDSNPGQRFEPAHAPAVTGTAAPAPTPGGGGPLPLPLPLGG